MSDDPMSHTILVVDDEEELREMLRDALELDGYSVVTADDGRDALEKVNATGDLCLVILDLLMPGMNGWEFLEKARQLPTLAGVPVIVHTSAASHAPSGVRVLEKPISYEGLLEVVREYCPS
jgi:CheY-like chemotaxis protein